MAKLSSRRFVPSAVGGLAVAMGLLLTIAPQAAATSKNVFSTSFTGSGSNALSNPSDIEVDQSTGDVYVSDPANFRVEKFTASGEFILMFGKGVNKKAVEHGAPEAEQDLCTAEPGEECQPGTQGLSPGAFYGNPLYLSVDNSGGSSNGDVYVGDTGDSLVSKFDPEGHLITGWGKGGQLDGTTAEFESFSPGTELGGLIGMSIDPAGNLFVSSVGLPQSESNYKFEFAPDGSFITQSQFFPQPIAVDGADNTYSIQGAGSAAPGDVIKNGINSFVLGSRNASGLRVDAPTRELYVTREDGTVVHLPASCKPVGEIGISGNPGPTCPSIDIFGAGHLSAPGGVAVDDATGTVYVADTGDHSVAIFTAEPYLPSVTALSAEALTPATEKLSATVDPDHAGPITACHFEYGETTSYGSGPLPCSPAAPIGSKLEVSLASNLEGLEYATPYHFHLVAENAHGSNASYDETFTTLPKAPEIGPESVSAVRADTALIHTQINPGGGETAYRVEYVTQQQFSEEGFAKASLTPSLQAGSARSPQQLTAHLSGLSPATTYHYRVIATNADDPHAPVQGTAHTFTTLPSGVLPNDPCSNAHVRQQTGSAQLLDCRAYELVSAADTGGYDVESNLIPGQSPFAGYPEAQGRVLYGVHNGGIPATNHPTNRGVDPYVATRAKGGWTTEYVGVPANNPFSKAPFSSVPSGADGGLETFAFGGPEGCSPCFEGEYTGIPVHLPAGNLVQGMVAGSGVPTPPSSATADGHIAQPLSANGEHVVFGSTSLFAEGGNDLTGDVSIYDHNLKTGETHVVSNAPSTEDFPVPLSCLQGAGKCSSTEHDANGISELAISKDGSHILLGQKVATDETGNVYWHLYMDANDGVSSIDLTPGTTHGVLFDGMTADGSRVFFTTKDALATASNQDTDESADLYLSEVSPEEHATLTRVSTGTEGTGNTDSCDPVANSAHAHWNTVSPEEENCGVVAIGGGGGVAKTDGTVYFLSPERLDGASNGTQNAPNLYVARPSDGYAPHYVTTLESVLTGLQPPKLRRTFGHNFGSFSDATGIAVEHSSGDVYVLDAGTNRVEKFDSFGHLITSFGDTENEITHEPEPNGDLVGNKTPAGSFAEFAGLNIPTQLAVDQSSGDLYVPDFGHGVVDKFDSSGNYITQIGGLEAPDGVAVDPANGNVYVSGLFGSISSFTPSGTPISSFAAEGNPTSIAVDSSGTVYVTRLFGETDIYDSSGNFVKALDPNPSQSVTVDPSNGDVYVNEGNQLARFDSSGKQLEALGTKELSGSVGVAIDLDGNLYASNNAGSQVALFPTSPVPSPSVDNPVVLDSVSDSEARHTADFQVSPNGEFAAFPSTLALAGGEEETAGHTVLYRYDAGAPKLACVSCTSTGAPSEGDSSLASNGLSLLGDGRVFFNSTDQLVSADADGRQDVYEFAQPAAASCNTESGAYSKATGYCLALISAGTSTFDSGLLSASAGGTDAYFFTRDSLAPQDKNGATVKIYDAREGGGFPYLFPNVECKASDECHGAASPSPPSIEVGTESGTPHNTEGEPKPCKKGFVKKHGHCVKPHKHKHHRRANHHRGGHK